MERTFSHIPVMLDQCMEWLGVASGRNFLDGTLGGGGHSRRILELSSPAGRLAGLDRDPRALEAARANLKQFGERALFFEGNFSEMVRIGAGIPFAIHGVLLDLGVSSPQIDWPQRGFSFQIDGPLDMRMGSTSLTAAEVVNRYSLQDLVKIFRDYGQERFSGKIARAIVRAREKTPISSTGQLARVITATGPAMPTKTLSRIFQAIRIEVNDELGSLQKGLQAALDILAPGGRLVVLTYHSLEDGLLKEFLRSQADPCTCSKELPYCICGRKPAVRVLHRKPIVPEAGEVELNPRARSAHLRAAEKI